MISRRTLLRGSGGLVLPMVPAIASAIPLSQPVRPSTPAVNWAHPMGKAALFSFIASGAAATTGAAIDLVRHQKGTATGTTTSGVLPWLGEVLTFASTNVYSFANRPTNAELAGSYWMLLQMTSITAGSDLFCDSTSGTGVNTGITATTGQLYASVQGVGTPILTGLTLAAGAPYLAIITLGTGTTGLANALLKRLDTGATVTVSVANPDVIAAGNGTYKLGAYSNSSNACTASIAAVAYSQNFLGGLNTLRSLAQDPWGPWRPNPGTAIEQMVAGSSAVVSHRPRVNMTQ